jgi:hypothetical protein
MYQRRTLALSDDERAALPYYRDHHPKPYVRERRAALLKIADRDSPWAVANAGLIRTSNYRNYHPLIHFFQNFFSDPEGYGTVGWWTCRGLPSKAGFPTSERNSMSTLLQFHCFSRVLRLS